MIKKVSSSLMAAGVFTLLFLFYSAAMAEEGGKKAKLVQRIEGNMDELENKVRSTLMFGGSSPVGFMGEARLKIQHHHLWDYPAFMEDDRDWTASGWEGNESMIRIGMIVRPSRNAVLWSKIGFQHTLPGNYFNPVNQAGWPNPDAAKNQAKTRAQGFLPITGPHDKAHEFANIHEDMSAGIALRSVPASGWLRMGAILWTEASPLTVWKSQNRTFAWDYLPFEVEQPISRYYEYNIAKGAKSGRAAWHKKPFQGIQLESINLPGDVYVNLIYGTSENFNKRNPVFYDPGQETSYAGEDKTQAKPRGKGDKYRHIIHGRTAKDLFGKVKGSLNYLGTRVREDWPFSPVVTGYKYAPFLYAPKDSAGKVFYTENNIVSFELRGRLNDKLALHTDIALSMVDTTYTIFNPKGLDTLLPPEERHGRQGAKLGIYGQLESGYGIPLTIDLGFFPTGFSSPFSFVNQDDAFFAFGSNLFGSGWFLAEGSPYTDNMTGFALKYAPEMGYGHLRVGYGIHTQIEKGRDILFFPFRLHGQDMFSFFQSSYNRWSDFLLDHSIKPKYDKRLGDESFKLAAFNDPLGPYAGGLRSGYLTMSEGFVAYESKAQADSNLAEAQAGKSWTKLRGFSYDDRNSSWVPEHKKWTFNFNIDGAYDIGQFIGYGNDLLVGAFFSIDGVSTSFSPVAFNQKDMLLWSTYFRLEPAIALTDKLYLLGMFGYENWRSDKAYMQPDLKKPESVNVPLDYRDMAYGIGIDWDIVARVGIHGRYKILSHKDKNFTTNNWSAKIASAEIKTWF